jgi:tRNA(fMet)-specific endonuclease VapC
MAHYMPNTKMCISLIRHQPEIVAHRFAQCHVGDVVMSAITFAELEYGIAVAAYPQQGRSHLDSLIQDIPVAPFDAAAGRAYASVRLATRDSRKDALDKLIAAHAQSLNVT